MKSSRFSESSNQVARRTFLGQSMSGFGSLALAGLLGGTARASTTVQDSGGILGSARHLHPKVKRVIHLCMAGGPSHLETFDYKPKLAELDGKPMPASFTEGQQIAQLQKKKDGLKCMGPQHGFGKHGQSGQEISDIFPEIAKVADEIAIIRSMQTEQINHDPAHTFMNTGSIIPGRPSMGSWVNYGIGSEAEDLPGFVVLTSEGGGQGQPISSRQWNNGFLPSKLQGVQFQSKGDAVNYVTNPPGVSREAQGTIVDAVTKMNSLLAERRLDPEIETRIAQYELAFKMQASVPGLMDVSGEKRETLERYGCEPGDGSYASNCLLARRLAERGVRFIQLYHRGWDHHGSVKDKIAKTANLVDRGTAALIKDLKERGMLEDTLIIWGGEFGRTPMAQGSGRDHHIKAFSIFMCGGGIKGGVTHGSTDELGYHAVDDIVHVHDLHATLLHLLGIDHEKLTFRFQGRDFRLTDVHGHIVKPILA